MATAATATQAPFTWEGTDRTGKKVKGKVVSTSEAAVRSELRRQGVLATKIKKQRTIGEGKVSPLDIAIFARQLATMMQAGVPLVQSFEIIGNGHEKPAMQKLVLSVKQSVEGGTSLAESLAKHPLYFDDLFVNLVEAGEQAGASRRCSTRSPTTRKRPRPSRRRSRKPCFIRRPCWSWRSS
jgi:type IV pilus assembly protein PilC